MINLSVCIEMFWRNLSVEEKISKVKELGFSAFEFWSWKNKNVESIKKIKEEMGLTLSAFCMEPNFCLTSDGNTEEIKEGLRESIKIASYLECKRLIVTTGNLIYGESFELTRRKVVKKLKEMAKIAEDGNIILVLEPLNPIVDHPGYWLNKSNDAADIVEEVNSPSLKILFDIYHQQVTEGNIISNINKYISLIGHFHTAGVPGRNELIGGELNYKNIFLAIEKLNYQGFVGLEFKSTKEDDVALKEVFTLVEK